METVQDMTTARRMTRILVMKRPAQLVITNDFGGVIASSALMRPGMVEALRVTTNPNFCDEHAESVELWSSGKRRLSGPEAVGKTLDVDPEWTLGTRLDQSP